MVTWEAGPLQSVERPRVLPAGWLLGLGAAPRPVFTGCSFSEYPFPLLNVSLSLYHRPPTAFMQMPKGKGVEAWRLCEVLTQPSNRSS